MKTRLGQYIWITYGMTKNAICWRTKLLLLGRTKTKHELTMLEPTATAMLRVSLSLTEDVTMMKYSAAFATMGRRITAMNS